MTTITILPEKADSYRALAGEKESTGRTPGEALDALTAQLADDESGTLVIVQHHKADKFFTAAQQERLAELMQLHEAGSLSPVEEQELERLVEAELVGASERANGLVGAIDYGGAELDASSYSDERPAAEEAVEQRTLDSVISDDVNDDLNKMSIPLAEFDRQILSFIVNGYTTEEVAEHLAISPAQVRLRLNAIGRLILRRREHVLEHTPASATDSDTAEKTK